ncbi:MAG: hypothetical protein KC800_29970, partial [Candidatus Eremiobacteraeota bacterium]|nr:hypothetical protein [Candidatus Eremiobacteraeota bacterium]
MLALSRMDRMTRMVVFGMLAFAGSFLLGESYLPTASYFWGLSAGRLLFCFLLVLLPATDAGRFRPTLVGLAVVSLAISALASPFLFSRWAFLTLLYLMLEVSIDALVLTRATEQEVPLELGMLAGCRLSGLWFGLFVQYSGLAEEIHPQRLALGAMLAILVFWVVARESTADRFLPQALRGSEDPSRDHLIKQFSLLANPWTAAALVGLACYSSLAGFHAGAILPYPLINPQDAGSWMNSILENLAILGVGLSGIFLFERLRLRNQLLAAGALTWGLEINDFLHHGSTPFWLWGLLLTSVLLSSRAVLRETYSMDPVFRAAVVITVWTAGGLSGQLAAISVSSSQEVFASLTLASTATLLAVVSWSRYAQAAKEISTPLPPSQHREARFGDRTLDFEAVPEPKR